MHGIAPKLKTGKICGEGRGQQGLRKRKGSGKMETYKLRE